MHQIRGPGHPAGRRALAALATLGAFGVTVVAPARPAQAETVNVTVANLAFDPLTVPVKLTGGEPGFDAPHAHVIWTMADAGVQHTVTFDDPRLVSSQPLTGGQRHEVVLYAPGTVTYRCTIHPAMKGSLVVEPGRPEPAAPVTAPVRSPDAVDPGTSGGSGSGSRAAPVAIGLSVLACAAVVGSYLLRRRPKGRTGDDDGRDGAGSGG